MRLATILATLSAFVAAGAAAALGARAVVAFVESASTEAVSEMLVEEGRDWASVQSDGLQVVIEGIAPSEADRFAAMSAAGRVVDASRVIDSMRVADQTVAVAPDFALEILRNRQGLTAMGLAPASTDRDRLTARLSAAADGADVGDFVDLADFPAPEGWAAALDFALRSAERLDRSQVSVAPGRVEIRAFAANEQERDRLVDDLRSRVPDGVEMVVEITAPRPVLTPFVTHFVLDSDGPRFEVCAAESEAGRDAIVTAALGVGMAMEPDCAIALGSPSAEWGTAVAEGIRALADLGGGSIAFTDADIALIANETTAPVTFERVVGEFQNALPDLFVLEADLLEPPDAAPEGPPRFVATLSPEGLVQLRGRVPDETTNTLIENFAAARFRSGEQVMGTRIADGLPAGWQVRILTALEGLSLLSNGSATVEPDRIEIRGNTGNTEASAMIAALLVEQMGEDVDIEVDVTYQEALDPVIALPSEEECIGRIDAVKEDRKIGFDPGSATPTRETQAIVVDIADILRQCPDLPLEIAGYTDSQGSEGGNLRLSQQRADAILSALRARRVPTSTYVAVGYGEADPIADNATEEGREANRRIEFRLIAPEPVTEEAGAPSDDVTEEDGE